MPSVSMPSAAMPGALACGGRMVVFLIVLACAPLRAQVDLGTLEIHSDPGTELHWEGISLGTIDDHGILEVADIPPGDYSIQLTKEGFKPAEVQMQIRAGERTVLQFALQAEPVPVLEPRPVPDVPAETPAAPPKTQSNPPPDVSAETSAAKAIPVSTPPEPPPHLSETEKDAPAPPEKEAEPAQYVSAETSDADPDVLRGPIPDIPMVPDAPKPPYVLIAGLAAVALIALVLYLRRNRPESPVLEPQEPQAPTIQRIPRPASSPEFLNDLKTRERDLDRFVPERRKAPRARTEPIDVEIIDVEITEVFDTPDPDETA